MTKEQLDEITEYLKWNVWRNENVIIISSLHNLLYEEVTGKRYNYAFHLANKVGSDVVDNIFDKEMAK